MKRKKCAKIIFVHIRFRTKLRTKLTVEKLRIAKEKKICITMDPQIQKQ